MPGVVGPLVRRGRRCRCSGSELSRTANGGEGARKLLRDGLLVQYRRVLVVVRAIRQEEDSINTV